MKNSDADEMLRLRALPYAEYLATAHWKGVARKARRLGGGRCQVCNSNTPPLHVHHRTYERRGCECPLDLCVLCAACHATFHDRIPAPAESQVGAQSFGEWLKAEYPERIPMMFSDEWELFWPAAEMALWEADHHLVDCVVRWLAHEMMLDVDRLWGFVGPARQTRRAVKNDIAAVGCPPVGIRFDLAALPEFPAKASLVSLIEHGSVTCIKAAQRGALPF